MKTACPGLCGTVIRGALLAATLTVVPVSASASDHGGGPARPPSPPSGVPLSTGANTAVDVQGVRFTPRVVTMRVGGSVTWTHRDRQVAT